MLEMYKIYSRNMIFTNILMIFCIKKKCIILTIQCNFGLLLQIYLWLLMTVLWSMDYIHVCSQRDTVMLTKDGFIDPK